MIAHNPLHGSGQAALPHPALALGEDAHAAERIGMTDGRQRQPASDETPHAVPKEAAILAASRQRAMPEPSHLEPKEKQRRLIHDVRQKRRGTSALGRPFLHTYSFPILQHAGIQPFLDEPHDAPICDPVLDKLHKPFVGKPIEKAFDVQIKHPVHFSRQQSGVESTPRLMLVSPWPEPIRKSEKVGFIDNMQAAPHDSGPMWVANPLSCDFFIHYTLAGLTGALEKRNENQSDQRTRGRPGQGPALLYGGTGICKED